MQISGSFLFYLSCLVFFVEQTENDMDFEFLFGNCLLLRKDVQKNENYKETKAHDKTNVRGSFETTLFYNLALLQLQYNKTSSTHASEVIRNG